MDKKKKKSLFVNIVLLIFLVVLIVATVILSTRRKAAIEKYKEENVELRNVGYDSAVSQVGFPTPKGMAEAFVSAFNNNSGEQLAAMMDLPALYVLEDVEEILRDEGVTEDLENKAIERFDDRYIQIMKAPDQYENFIAMQYSMAEYEKEVINGMPLVVPTYTLLNKPEIQDITRFISKMTLEIKVESEEANINTTDTLELLLFKRDDSYHLLRYAIKDPANN